VVVEAMYILVTPVGKVLCQVAVAQGAGVALLAQELLVFQTFLMALVGLGFNHL